MDGSLYGSSWDLAEGYFWFSEADSNHRLRRLTRTERIRGRKGKDDGDRSKIE